MDVHTAEFLGSQTDYQKCPPGEHPEFAFVGRSNVGKSSLINMITGRRSLAKTSSTPGKTQLINHFLINSKWYLVDLPGYGWAKVSKAHKRNWESMVRQYLLNRSNLVCTFILIDSRHPLQKSDRSFLTWVGTHAIPFVLVFTKVDKVANSLLAGNINRFKKEFLQDWQELPRYFMTSSAKNRGRQEILSYIGELST